MPLRKELEPIERDVACLALPQNKIEFMEQLLEQGLDSAADEIAAFNVFTGLAYKPIILPPGGTD
ncbi:hypothetical protein [Paenibacillus sp. y28]|uniref:hypothetical protein n=1 Tax=Paenibacillus sp. y28 TaxID=3129110 RepID=UPI003016504F